MKKLGIFLLAVAFCFCLVPFSQAADRYQISPEFAVKVDYFHFFDSAIKSAGAQDAVYVGGEFYYPVFFPNFFLGVEAGWAGPSGTISETAFGRVASLDTDITYIPIELNMKYVMPINPCWNFAIGAGVSANYMNFDTTLSGLNLAGNSVSINANDNQGLFGGQFFAEFNYRYLNWEFGIDAKYQLTTQEDFHFATPVGVGILPISGDNVRAGGHIRWMF